MKKISLIILTFFLCTGVSMVESAPASDNSVKIPQLTRSVKIFSELETELINALKTNNQTQLKQLLTEDFEMRQASEPGNPVPYALWLSNSLTEASKYTANIEQMSVHDLNQTAIANFFWFSTDSRFFVVDVWKHEGSNWKLAIRYISPAQDVSSKVPGFIPNAEPVIDKRY